MSARPSDNPAGQPLITNKFRVLAANMIDALARISPDHSPQDSTAMVTKRVHKRQVLLLDEKHVNQIIEYTLAYRMRNIDMSLHAIVVEGNHIHRADTDPDAVRPAFIQKLHSLGFDRK